MLNSNALESDTLYARSTLEKDGLFDFIKSLGGDPYAIAGEVNLDVPPYKSKIHFNSWTAMCQFFEISAARLNQPYLGLKWAFEMPKDYRASGPTIFLGSVASDMRHFVDMLLDYQKIHTNGVTYSVEENIDAQCFTGVISIHPYSPPCRQFCEQIMAAIAVMGRRYVPDFKIQSVTFQHSAPVDMTWYKKAFECEVRFNADRNTVVMDRHFLNMKRSSPLTKLISPVLKSYLKSQVKKNPQSSTPISLLIAETLPNIIGVKNSDIETVAEALGFHPKKLQRLLNHEGTSYSSILDDVRKSLAKRLLIETDISIGRIAVMLDYSSDRPFGVAVKRWFGMTPMTMRKQAR